MLGGPQWEGSKQRLESSGPKVPIVRKGLGYSQPPHNRERDMVHNACAISLTALVAQPCGAPILVSRRNKMMPQFHLLVQSGDCGAVWPTGASVAAFEQHETACYQIRPRNQ